MDRELLMGLVLSAMVICFMVLWFKALAENGVLQSKCNVLKDKYDTVVESLKQGELKDYMISTRGTVITIEANDCHVDKSGWLVLKRDKVHIAAVNKDEWLYVESKSINV